MNKKQILSLIETNLDRYLDFLCDICSYEATAFDRETLDRLIEYIEAFAQKEGFSTEKSFVNECGAFLSVDLNSGGEKSCVFMAHTDTVHQKGVFGNPPVRRLEDRIIAPGVIDCKGGIAIALLAMKALKETGFSGHVRLLLTSDEELSNRIGGAEEIRYFEEKTQGFPCAINCETSEGDEVVISRKGILKGRIDIKGISGHSGIHYFECVNPIEEAAHKILALHGKSQRGGITYSCNIIHGGVLENIIPETCSVSVDIRYPRRKDFEQIEQTLREVVETSYVKGSIASFQKSSQRPPMEQNEDTEKLFCELREVCHRYGFGDLTPVPSGGGSDSCYTQAAGIPSICGMGACGEFCHTDREYASIASIELRAKILSMFLADREK